MEGENSFSFIFEREFNVNLDLIVTSGKVEEKILRIQAESLETHNVYLKDVLDGDVSGFSYLVLTEKVLHPASLAIVQNFIW